MLLSKYVLPAVLVVSCFGALACSEEEAPRARSSIDSGVDEEPEDDSDAVEEEEPKAKKDAGTKKDAGAKDAGKDSGTTTRPRGIDSGAGDAASGGPSVVDVDRDPAPGSSGGGIVTTPENDKPLVDIDGEPAVRTTQCPLLAYVFRGNPDALEGCCLASGDCGSIGALSPQICETHANIRVRLGLQEGLTFRDFLPSKCDPADGR